MINSNLAMAAAVAVGLSAPAQAITRTATASTLAAVFAAAKAGDTIRVTGTVGSLGLADRNFASMVTIDATRAVFTDSLVIKNVSNLTIVGGTFGSTTASLRTDRKSVV